MDGWIRMTKVIKMMSFQDLGKGLKEIRGDMTLKDLGKILELTTSYISEIERGYKIPSLNVIARYADRTETDIRISFEAGDFLKTNRILH